VIYYFVANEQGDRVSDKDGFDYKPPEDITLEEFTNYGFKTRQAAEGHRDWQDPEGRSGLQVISREVEFNIR
jgi:hypothetical protein